MNFQVIGWTDYENDAYPMHSGDFGAVDRAVVEAIRAGGFRFGGDTHQSGAPCTPVLNDGTRACYSFREWGYLMAEAYELRLGDDWDYMAWYMDIQKELDGETLILPPAGVDKARIVARSELCEEFSVPVSPAALNAVRRGAKTKEILTKENGFERVCKGDVLCFTCGEVCRVRVTKTEDFASFDALFKGSEWDSERELRRRKRMISCALYAGCDAEQLYRSLSARFPDGGSGFSTVVFSFVRVR